MTKRPIPSKVASLARAITGVEKPGLSRRRGFAERGLLLVSQWISHLTISYPLAWRKHLAISVPMKTPTPAIKSPGTFCLIASGIPRGRFSIQVKLGRIRKIGAVSLKK
jgi:hypothetical protein